MIDLVIFTIAFAYVVISTGVTNLFSDQKRIKHIQKTFSDIRNEFEQALKEKNDARMKEIEQRQSKSMPLLMEQTLLMFKPLIVLLPMLIVLLQEIRFAFPGFSITIPISIPVAFQNFEQFPNWRDTFGPLGWFWISVLLNSLLLSAIRWVYGKFFVKQESGEKPTVPVSK